MATSRGHPWLDCCTAAMFTIFLSLVITSIYPRTSVYANVKCPTRDNTSPNSADFDVKNAYDHGYFENEDSKPRRETETCFFSSGGLVCFLAQTLA